MHTHYTPKGKHLTIVERQLIERWLKDGKSHRQIASLLGKAPQTINNEVKRGLILQQVKKNKYRQVYSADYAQMIYRTNKSKGGRKCLLTKELKEKICHYIKQKFSPEMIIKAKGIEASVSTLYYWIHNGHLGLESQNLLYPRKRKVHSKQASPNFKPFGKSIEERSEVINQRLENGHYEIDTVILTQKKNNCLLTLTDRRSRFEIIRLIPDKTAKSVNQALREILVEHSIKSITADNGTEFARLAEVFPQEEIYYAHPYSSWERGTNENHNRLIRRWLPKGTKEATHKLVACIENWINNYPKKCLDYRTPREVMENG